MNKVSDMNDKKRRVINASLKLFSKKGYKHTTTDEITKEANISKGLLFHYFHTKKNLYLSVFDYSIDFIVQELDKHKLDEITDLFEYIKQGTKIKWDVVKKHPYIYTFLVSALKEENKEISEYVISKSTKMKRESWDDMLKKIDRNKFKNPNDVEKIVSLITYYSNGLMQEFIETENMDIKKASDEFFEILSMLKENFYGE